MRAAALVLAAALLLLATSAHAQTACPVGCLTCAEGSSLCQNCDDDYDQRGAYCFEKGINIPAVVGGVVGGVFFLIFACLCCVARQQKQHVAEFQEEVDKYDPENVVVLSQCSGPYGYVLFREDSLRLLAYSMGKHDRTLAADEIMYYPGPEGHGMKLNGFPIYTDDRARFEAKIARLQARGRSLNVPSAIVVPDASDQKPF